MANNKSNLGMVSNIAGPAMGLVGGLLDTFDIGGNRRRRKQIEQQQKLTEMQIAANKELADYGMGISKEMFEHTGYAAQRRQMEEAGLNPALMYGQAGEGGSTMSAVAGSAGTGLASDEASQKMASIQARGMALQLTKLQSEIDINKAKARDLNVSADKKEGVDTDLVKANIADITQSIKNKEAQEAGQKLQNDYDKIRNYISKKTVDYDIGYVGYMAAQAKEQWQILINNREISDATKDDIVENYKLMNQNIIADMMLKDKKADLTVAQVGKMAQDIMQGWEDLRIKEEQGDRRLSNEERANDIKARYPTLHQMGGGMLNEVLITLDKLNPFSKGSGWSAK
ncbi:MAG: hypothetical protein GX957_09180 [Clostridiaceae bacterium]|nr:hypothetical protein [Clostridiaceae bacterium]